jgi:tetratricopeptide (TPR) repeat protein
MRRRAVNRRVFFFALYMIPVIWSLIRDLFWEDLSVKEIRINYLFGKANAFERARWWGRATHVYQEIIRKDPKSIPALLNLGGLFYRREKYEKAIPCYERVIRINPKHYQAHYWLARCCWKLQRYYAAINTLEEVIEFLPTFKDALNLMGECYEQIGEAAKAEHFFLKAISTDPGGMIIHQALEERKHPEKKGEGRIKN